MPYETLRFLHAARVFVDHPLCDTGLLTPPMRTLARDATTLAFRNLIRACLDHDVDFLLLTGDSLDQSDFSVKARVELRRGCEQLDEYGIQVFVVPGPSDPTSVWEEIAELPGNVTIFRPESDDPVAVIRDGAVIASIRALTWRQSWFAWDDDEPQADRAQRRAKEADTLEANLVEPMKPGEPIAAVDGEPSDAHRETRRIHSPAELRPNHFSIAIVRDGIDQPNGDPQADYLAVVGGGERATSKGGDWLRHFPGGTQGVSPRESGARGCSLVELDGEGVIHCRFVPTAAVRWDAREIHVAEDATLARLADELRTICHDVFGSVALSRNESKVIEFDDAADPDDLEALPVPQTIPDSPHAAASFWFWSIHGHGSLFDRLCAAAGQAELIDHLNDDAAWPTEISRQHIFRMLAAEPEMSRCRSGDAANGDATESLDVLAEFVWRVDQAQPLGASAWNDLGNEDSITAERLTRVQAVAPNCDAHVVFSLARRRGWYWFAAPKNSIH